MPTTVITPDRTEIRNANLVHGGTLDIVRGSHTGSSGWTTVATVTVPAGIIGPNGAAMFEFAFSCDATPNAAWGCRVQFDGSDIFTRSVGTSNLFHVNNRIIANDAAEDAQVFLSASAGVDDTGDDNAAATLTKDTSQEFDVTFQVNLDATDTARTITLEYGIARILGLSGD